MSLFLGMLAFLGFMAVLAACLRSALRYARGGVESFIASEVASARAGRGDLSGMSDAQDWRSQLRRARRWHGLHAVAWLLLLLVPLLTPMPREIYAVYSILWLLPLWRRPRPAS